MKTNAYVELRPVKARFHLSELKVEPETFQFREKETEEYHVKALMDAIKAGYELDLLTVWKRSEGDYVVVDGHHRYAAFRRLGYKKKVRAIVYECSEAEAKLLALNENIKTKLPMTKTERQNAAWRLVCSDHPYSKAQTARATGVSERSVANMRAAKKKLNENEYPLPDTWWEALQVEKGFSHEPLSADEWEARIEAEANRLDDKIGLEISLIGDRQWKALAEVLSRRLDNYTLGRLVDYLSDHESMDDEDDLPF